MTTKYPRRGFLQTAALAAAAATVVPRHVLGGPRHVAPSEKMNVAGIGVGGMGGANLHELEGENIVALCDVDHAYAAGRAGPLSRAKKYKDYRVMLERQRDIDGVVVATPDHTHAIISIAAMKAGKHVYCQKPLTHDLYEARMMAKAAKECKVATQMGIQGHSMDGGRLVCEWVWAGLIGEVREVDAWCSLSYYPWGHAGWSSPWSERPRETPPLPPGLEWDLWIGPAPMRPYHRAYHPTDLAVLVGFRLRNDGRPRGTHLRRNQLGFRLGPPASVDATTCGNTAEVHPLSAIVTFQFPARGEMPPVKLTWYEGTRPPRPEELEDGRQSARRRAASSSRAARPRSWPACTARARGSSPSGGCGRSACRRGGFRGSAARTSRTGCGRARPACRRGPISPTPAR